MSYPRIFVTGLGLITPVGLDAKSSWNNLIGGVSGIDYISAFDAEGFETRIAAEVKNFSPGDFMDAKKARRMDRFAQFAMVASQEAAAQAQLDMAKLDPTRVITIIGSGIGGLITLSEQFQVLKDKGPTRVSPFLIPMMLPDMASGNVSMGIGTKGPNFCTTSSCSSGAEAIGTAWNMLRNGDADIALAGGTEAPICPIAVAGFNSCQALSRRNDDPKSASRPFDAQRDGFVMGEGSGVLVLETEESVRRRGVPVIAELIGYGASSDAYHVTQPAPGGEGGARAMRLALRAAGIQPNEIEYINAHGTSTPLNDKFETMGIKAVFGDLAPHIPISSTKSMTGHLLGAAAAIEAAISVLALQNGVIPPTVNYRNPDSECDLDYVPNEARIRPLRTAMSNALGFGGHNSSLIFRQPGEMT
ncbi:MAG: beta-ketoacyl-ACP synthase II [Chloroflexi bacterium]|nr:beta-ketoacyl-ACP synthase II [Chloroflexota bacterium]